MGVEEVFAAVSRDKIFYDGSGGGVTASGGEPLLHAQFVCALFGKCRQNGIHTCIETSGHAAASALREVLAHTDYVLYDLKLLDSSRHRECTGKSNNRVLANAKVAAESGVELRFRMPLIPDITDTRKNISDTAGFLHSLGGGPHSLELMPYHRLGVGKYESLDKQYLLPEADFPTQDQVEEAIRAFEDLGIVCSVSS
jgi:pyruvate formate lyase activating enzyme